MDLQKNKLYSFQHGIFDDIIEEDLDHIKMEMTVFT